MPECPTAGNANNFEQSPQWM